MRSNATHLKLLRSIKEKFDPTRISVLLFALVLAFSSAAQQIKESDVPANVKEVAMKQSSNQPITMWVLDKELNKYLATVVSATAVLAIEISLDGKWIETTAGVFPDKMPAPVMKAATDGFPGYELGQLLLHYNPGQKSPYYIVDASSDDEGLTLTIDPKGKILERNSANNKVLNNDLNDDHDGL